MATKCNRPGCNDRQEFPDGPSPHCLDHSLEQFFWYRPLAEFGPVTDFGRDSVEGDQ